MVGKSRTEEYPESKIEGDLTVACIINDVKKM